VAGVLHVPEGSALKRVMVLPERGVVPAVRVPERVKGWLAAGVVVLGEMVRVLSNFASTAGAALQNNNAPTKSTTATTTKTLFSAYISSHFEHHTHTRATGLLRTRTYVIDVSYSPLRFSFVNRYKIALFCQ
jgi:hypothetical protein